MRNIFYFILFFICNTINSQVGINVPTITPRSTLDINGSPADPNKPDGLVAPRITLDQLILKKNLYGIDQTGLILYVYDVETSEDIANDQNLIPFKFITLPGYYYFDGVIWKSLEPKTGSVMFAASLGVGSSGNFFTLIKNDYTSIKLNKKINIGGTETTWDEQNYQYTIPVTGTYLLSGSLRRDDEFLFLDRTFYINIGKVSDENSPDGIWRDNIHEERFTILYTRIAYLYKGEAISLYGTCLFNNNDNGDGCAISNAYLSITLLNQTEN